MNISDNLEAYLGERSPTARYASFDYCFNYFQRRRESNALDSLLGSELEVACLHLAFYLASWGMLRGSSVLLKRSVKYYEPVINAIAESNAAIWEIDANMYDPVSIEALLLTAQRLRRAFPEPASDILVTKTMLGVFGCVPAFDTYFKRGFGVWKLARNSLEKIGRFYNENADVVESHRVRTLDFDTGAETSFRYPRAKVIDMIFFVEGMP